MLPGITREQMVLVDEIMVTELGVRIEMMMEHAGEALARHAVKCAQLTFEKTVISASNIKFVAICGNGNNGGGGLVAARRLKAWGLDVLVVIPKGKESLREIPKKQLDRASKFGVPVVTSLPENLPWNSVILDAFIGYGYHHRGNSLTESVFRWMMKQGTIVSLDVPSGLDVNDGTHHGRFKPFSTLTLAFVKAGLLLANPNDVGLLSVADIGVPTWIYEKRLNLDWTSPFSLKDLSDLYDLWRRWKILACTIIHDENSKIVGWSVSS